MITRRLITRTGFAGLLAIGATRQLQSAAQTPTSGLEYQGVLAIQNLPELPKAPAGECAIVLQAHGADKAAAVVYHNASEESVCVNAITATATTATGAIAEDFNLEETVHAPHILQPGEYGIACPAFEWALDAEHVVTVELTLVPEAEADPALVSLPILEVEFATDGDMQEVRTHVENRSETNLAEGCGAIGIFFTPEGEILDWFASNFISDFEAGNDRHLSTNSNTLEISDSFMIAFGGRAIE